jgi:hypothetical protein
MPYTGRISDQVNKMYEKMAPEIEPKNLVQVQDPGNSSPHFKNANISKLLNQQEGINEANSPKNDNNSTIFNMFSKCSNNTN